MPTFTITKTKAEKRKAAALDYALQEYGMTLEELDRFARRLHEETQKQRRAGTVRSYSGDLEADCR